MPRLLTRCGALFSLFCVFAALAPSSAAAAKVDAAANLEPHPSSGGRPRFVRTEPRVPAATAVGTGVGAPPSAAAPHKVESATIDYLGRARSRASASLAGEEGGRPKAQAGEAFVDYPGDTDSLAAVGDENAAVPPEEEEEEQPDTTDSGTSDETPDENTLGEDENENEGGTSDETTDENTTGEDESENEATGGNAPADEEESEFENGTEHEALSKDPAGDDGAEDEEGDGAQDEKDGEFEDGTEGLEALSEDPAGDDGAEDEESNGAQDEEDGEFENSTEGLEEEEGSEEVASFLRSSSSEAPLPPEDLAHEEAEDALMLDPDDGTYLIDDAGRWHRAERPEASEVADLLATASSQHEQVESGLGAVQLAALRQFSTSAGDCTVHATTETTLTLGSGAGAGTALSLTGHDVKCPAGRMLGRFRIEQGSARTKVKVSYTCCRYGGNLGTCTNKQTGVKMDAAGNFLSFRDHDVSCPSDYALTRWQMKKSGSKVNVDFTCCKPNADWAFSDCSDLSSTAARHGGGTDLLMLRYHNVNCGSGDVVSRWHLEKSGSEKVLIQRKCCSVAQKLTMGTKEATCVWWGDPHFVVFDNKVAAHRRTHNWQTANSNQLGSGKYWVVKSRYVAVQAEYCQHENPCRGNPAVTRKVAIGGIFLRGHKLVIHPLRGDIYLDGKKVGVRGHRDWSHNVNGLLTMRHHGGAEWSTNGGRGWGLYVELPLGVRITANRHGHHLDVTLKMKQLPGGQDGHCGNFNDNPNDDKEANIKSRAGNFIVAAQDDLFKDGQSVPGLGAGGKKLSDCKGQKLAEATATCKKNMKTTQNDMAEAFLKMCIFDVCFVGKEFGSAAGAQENQFEEEIKLEDEIPFQVIVPPVSPAAFLEGGAAAVCPKGLVLAMPKSLTEQKAIEGIVAASSKETTDRLLMGGKWVKGSTMWQWDDSSPIDPDCGFTHWAYDDWRTPPNQQMLALCMRRQDYRWEACDMGKEKKFSVICTQPKKYVIFANAFPVAARSICGDGKQMAMPKSKAEQDALFKVVKGQAGSKKVWLGAKLENGNWKWDDDSPVCGYTNWASTKTTSSAAAESFMCMSASTGKWINCGDDKTKTMNVACEVAHKTPDCEKGKFNGKQQGLATVGSTTAAKALGHCYYIAKMSANCEDTCKEQISGGKCDLDGLQLLERSSGSCRMVLDIFGLPYSSGNAGVKKGDSSMCTYYEANNQKEARLLRRSDIYTSCLTKAPASSHRMCACTKG